MLRNPVYAGRIEGDRGGHSFQGQGFWDAPPVTRMKGNSRVQFSDPVFGLVFDCLRFFKEFLRVFQDTCRSLLSLDLASLAQRLLTKLADWRGLLRRNVEDGRAVFGALLTAPLRFTPVVEKRRRGYAFEGTIGLDRLLAGVVNLPPLVASPRGTDTKGNAFQRIFRAT